MSGQQGQSSVVSMVTQQTGSVPSSSTTAGSSVVTGKTLFGFTKLNVNHGLMMLENPSSECRIQLVPVVE